MHVLQILPSIGSESGGPARSTLANCRALQAVAPEIRFTLVTTGKGLETDWRKAFEARMPPGMELQVFAGVGRHAFMVSPHMLLWLWKHITEFDLAVVRALLHPVSSSAAWIARHLGVPYLIVPHGTLSNYTFQHRRTLLKRAYLGLVERQTLAAAEAVRFTSESERLEAPASASATEARVIPHPYEPRRSQGEPCKRNPSQILFLSRIHPKKGIKRLLEAVQLVLSELPEARLVIAGSGTKSFEKQVRSRIDRLGLEEAIRLPGFVEGDEKRRLFDESSIFVLPSRQENFGIAVVEAMDAGLPVVISREVDIWPEIEEGEAGIVVGECTPRAVADALVKLLRNDTLRDEMGRNGRKLVSTAFDPESVGGDLRRLYWQAAEGGGALAQSLSR